MGPKGKSNADEHKITKAGTCLKSHHHDSEEDDDECCSHHEINFHDASCRVVYALKGNQKELDIITQAFEVELRELERKFEAISQPYFLRRRAIVLGETDPVDEDVAKGKESLDKRISNCNDVKSGVTVGTSKVEIISSSEEEEVPTKKGCTTKGGVRKVTPQVDSISEKGIPHFWLNVLKRQFDVSKRDAEVLKHLIDIQCSSIDNDPFLGYALRFQFSENPFFTNEVLTKHYYQEREFNESVLVRTEGCKIDWKARTLNTTVEIKKKTQKNKVKKTTRVVEKEVKVESFFDFFDPPKIPEDNDDSEDTDEDKDYEELEQQIEYDYEMGNQLKDNIIPMAVNSYLGLLYSNQYSFPEAFAAAADMIKNEKVGGPGKEKIGEQADCKQQ